MAGEPLQIMNPKSCAPAASAHALLIIPLKKVSSDIRPR